MHFFFVKPTKDIDNHVAPTPMIMLLSFKMLTVLQALLVIVPAFYAAGVVYLYASLIWGPALLILIVAALVVGRT